VCVCVCVVCVVFSLNEHCITDLVYLYGDSSVPCLVVGPFL